MTIKWYAKAVADLDKLYDYYVKLNPNAAVMLYNKILDNVQILETQPYIAAVEQLLEDYPEGYRSLVVAKKYKAVYFIQNNTILIVQIFDCRQNSLKLKRTVLKRRSNPK